MQAGKLRHRVTVQRPTTTASASGAPQTTWAAHCTRWSEVATGQRAERILNGREISEGTVAVLLRADGLTRQITNKYRVLLSDGRVLDVESAHSPDPRGTQIALSCRERPEA